MTDQSYKLSGLLEQLLGARGLQDCEIICRDGRVECHSTMLVVAKAYKRKLDTQLDALTSRREYC